MGIDIKVPEEEQIISDLKRIVSEPLPLQAEYNLLLDSGLRLIEVVRLLNNFPEAKHLEGFYRCPVGFFRDSKQAYYCYTTEYTYQLIKKLNEKVSEIRLKRLHQLHKYIRAKYLRKFANDMMTSERLNIPESGADFIQGRGFKKHWGEALHETETQSRPIPPKIRTLCNRVEAKSGSVNILKPFPYLSGFCKIL